ncbi:MAG: diacylglycerol/lipid kinase family protein [Alphaproteobacteria bacterium]
MNLLLINNPTAGGEGAMRLRRLLAILSGMGAHVTRIATQEAGHAERIGFEHDFTGIDRIVVAGGDGTLNEVVNGLQRRTDGIIPPPIAFAPFGTANVLAHELALDRSVEGIARKVMQGEPFEVTPGISNGRRFVLMVSAGIDSIAVDGVDPAIKARTGPLAYVWSGLQALGQFKNLHLRITVDNHDPVDGATVIVTRGHKYGGFFVTAPDARLEDEALHAVIFKNGSLAAVFGYAWGLTTARLQNHPDITIISGKQVRVEAPTGKPIPVQADGDITTATPLDLSLDSRPIRLVR